MSPTQHKHESSPYPAASPNPAPTHNSQQPKKTSLQRWLEPPVKAPIPPPVEAPIAQNDRLEVAPSKLGVPPSDELRTAAMATPAAPNGRGKIKLSFKGRAEASASSTPRAASPEPAPPPAKRLRSESRLEDDDYIPEAPVNGTKASSSRASMARSTASKSHSTPRGSAQPQDNLLQADQVVEVAIARAIDELHMSTAYALRLSHNERRSDPHYLDMVTAVYKRVAEPEQYENYEEMISTYKRQGSKARKAQRLYNAHGPSFAPPAPNFAAVNFAAVKYESPSKKAVAPTQGTQGAASGEARPSPAKPSPIKESPSKRRRDQATGNGATESGESKVRSLARSPSLSSLSSALSVDEDDRLLEGEAAYKETAASTTVNKAPGPPKLSFFSGANSHAASFSPINSIQAATRNSQNNSHHNNMPGLVAQNNNTRPTAFYSTGNKSHKKGAPGHGTVKRIVQTEEDIEIARMKREARAKVERETANEGSFLRSSSQVPESESETVELPSIASQPARSGGSTLRFTSSRAANNGDELTSPTILSFQAGTDRDSRAGTPSRFSSRKKVKAGSGPRMKTSPMKKRTGTVAGTPRGSERNRRDGLRDGLLRDGLLRDSPNDGKSDDNDEYCSACSGSGDLICCEGGCLRSFHAQCLGVEGEHEIPGDWYCPACVGARNPPMLNSAAGPFGKLLYHLEMLNPVAFRLPLDIRDHFEGVRTGPDGEYEEGIIHKARQTKSGWEVEVDHMRLRDNKGKAIICHECHNTALTGQPIIPCNSCSLSFHLDCLDPPLSNPPPPGKWKCPCHVDDLLNALPGALGPAHKFRKPKAVKAVKPAFSHGNRNNGHIEIENEPSDKEDGFYDQKEYGQVYKLPERGIKLDFLSKARAARGLVEASAPGKRKNAKGHQKREAPALRSIPSIEEQQAALTLSSIASRGRLDPNDPDNHVETLVHALLTQAPAGAISLIAQADAATIAAATPPAANRTALLAMKAFIEQQLASIDGSAPQPKATNGTQQNASVGGHVRLTPTPDPISDDERTAPPAEKATPNGVSTTATAVQPDHISENASAAVGAEAASLPGAELEPSISRELSSPEPDSPEVAKTAARPTDLPTPVDIDMEVPTTEQKKAEESTEAEPIKAEEKPDVEMGGA